MPVGTVGDNYDRFRVRLEEMRESLQASSSRRSTACPRGRTSPTNRKVALPPRHELATSMEALIHHFKLVTEGFRVPPGETYAAIESPRGELGCFVLADGSAKPARVHMRDPSFVNLQALPEMAPRAPAGGLHRLRRDARPDPRRSGPVKRSMPQAARGAVAARRRRLGRGRRPRGDRRPRSRIPPRSRCPTTLRTTIERLMALYPDRHSATLPALGAAQRVHGWCSPEAMLPGGRGDAGHARRTCRAWRPSTTCCAPSRVGSRYVYVCTSVACHVRNAKAVYDAIAARGASTRASRTWRCASSNASARATWRRWPPSTAATWAALDDDAPRSYAR